MVYIILSIIVMMDITHNKSLYILQVASQWLWPTFLLFKLGSISQIIMVIQLQF
jgi:hypothetical protein